MQYLVLRKEFKNDSNFESTCREMSAFSKSDENRVLVWFAIALIPYHYLF